MKQTLLLPFVLVLLFLGCQISLLGQDCDNDTTVPAVNCQSGLSFNLAPNGQLVLEAKEIDAGTTDNCTENANLRFSFSDDPLDSMRIFGCDDLGTVDLELWVTDEAGNQDFCTSFMSIEDVFNACGGGGNPEGLSGCITTELGVPMEGVNICLFVDPLPEPFFEGQVDGCYTLQIPDSQDFSATLTPKKNDNPTNGVTTFDAIIIRKHILDIERLPTPYKMIAADINNSGSVSTFDIVLMRKLILGVDDHFTNNSSWRFVDRDYVFPDPNFPSSPPFPESIEVNGGAMGTVDFIAIKIGDVNDSAEPALVGEDESKN